MATGYIFNAFKGVNPDGSYETREDPKTGEPVYGITLTYGGKPFWFAYQKVTPVPNYAICELDHDKSTPARGETGYAVYRNEFIDGMKLAKELTENQIPVPNKDKGIQIIEGKATGEVLPIFAGVEAGTFTPIMAEVPERVATKAEIERAEAAAKQYKETVIAEYFDSKRQRMTGGQGKHVPDKITRVFMQELNVEDNDDVTAHQKALQGITPEMLKVILEENRKASEINGAKLIDAIDVADRSHKARSLTKGKGRKSLNLAENKAKFEAEHPEEAKVEA